MPIAAGRAVNSVFTARAGGFTPGAPGAGAGLSWDWVGWPRTGAMCAPVIQCCCKGPWTIGPGETLPLILDWSAWLGTVQGYSMFEVKSAALWDMTKSPPVAADPAVIKVLTGKTTDPDPPDNSDVADLVQLIPPQAMQLLIEAAPNARIGDQYKLDVCLTACDGCEGRKITMCDCVVITIQEC